MNSTPAFSVILPAYNAAHLIRHMIQAVLNQSFSDFELLLVDDGSADETLSMMRSFETDERVLVITKENGGVSSARNAGLRAAKGKYVVFADADDDLDCDYLQVFAEIMQDAEMGICGFAAVHKDGSSNEVYRLKAERISAAEVMDRAMRFRDITSACWNKCFLRSVIVENGLSFDEKLSIGEDLLFILSYCQHIQTAVLTDRVLYTYVLNESSAMNEISGRDAFNEKWLTEWDAIRKAEKMLEEDSISLQGLKIKQVRIANKLLNLMRRYGYHSENVKKELIGTIRQYYSDVIGEKEFSAKMKLSITLKRLGIM